MLSSLTHVPILLIVTASMVIDRCLRFDCIQDRLQCQVWMWLAVALSIYQPQPSNTANDMINTTSDNPTKEEGDASSSINALVLETWVHLTIFSNILAIGWAAKSTGLHRHQPASKRHAANLNLLAPACWLAMISSCTLMITTSSISSSTSTSTSSSADFKVSLQVFSFSLCILWMFQWHGQRKRRLAHELQGIPSSIINTTTATTTSNKSSNMLCSFYSSSPPIDETLWYTWNVSTTLQWISQLLTMDRDLGGGDGEEEKEQHELVLFLLVPHCIYGDILDTLTVKQLLQLQVPYGPACRLAQAIQQRLVRTNPKPRNTNIHTTAVYDSSYDSYGYDSQQAPSVSSKPIVVGVEQQQPSSSSDWLTLHDQEYNRQRKGATMHSQPAGFQSNPAVWNDNQNLVAVAEPTATPPAMDPEQQKRLESLMQERYGLDLPKLNTTNLTGTSSYAPPFSNSQTSVAPNTGSGPFSNLPGSDPASHGYTTANRPTMPSPLSETGNHPLSSLQPNNSIPATAASPPPPVGSFRNDPSDNPLSTAILDQMPPHIQAIVKRRPDLIQQIFQERKTAPSQSHSLTSELVDVVLQEEDTEDDETTNLIQRKRGPRYKSMDPHGS